MYINRKTRIDNFTWTEREILLQNVSDDINEIVVCCYYDKPNHTDCDEAGKL